MQQLEPALQAYHINALREIADQLALRPDHQPPPQAWLVTELDKLIPRMAQSEAFIQALTDAERAALAVMADKEDPFTFPYVARPLMLAGMAQIEGQSETTYRPRVKDILSDLLRKGLIVNLVTPSSGSALRTLTLMGRFCIPAEVRSVLPIALLPYPHPKSDLVVADSVMPYRIESHDPELFLRELLFVWAEFRDQPAQPLKAGGIGKRERRRLANALGLAEPEGLERVAWLYQVLAALNLLAESTTAITAVEGQAVTLFWSARATQHLRDLRQSYARITAPLSKNHTTLRLTGYLQGLDMRPPHLVREKIVTTLEQTSALGWQSFTFFLSLLTGDQAGSLILDDTILAAVYDQLHWYGNAYRNEVETTLRGIERTLVQGALAELCTMGLVELGYSQADAQVLIAVRAVPTGQAPAADRIVPPSHREQPWQMILQPDFQLLALGPVPLRVLASVEQIAHREKIDESVVTYRLTREAVYHALRNGETVATITTYLEETTGQPVPQNIQRSLEEWYRQYERIVVRRRVRILQVDGADRLVTLLDDPQLRQHLHPIDDRTAWFLPDDTDLIQKRLQAYELLAATSHGAQVDLPNSMRWRGEELEPRTALPSLYVAGTLARFAEPHGKRWYVTSQTVHAAAALGMPPLEIIAQLKTLTGTPLPDGMEKRLKAWGKHFGDSQTAQVRLLRFKRSEAFAELRAADPILHRWLRPLPGLENLAIVNEAHWDEVMALLTSWGVDVDFERWW